MKILLTGSTGVIGKILLPRLLEKKHSVICIGRNKPDLENPLLEFVEFDFSSQNSLELKTHVDLIIHLAGLPSGEGKSLQDYLILNSESVDKLLEFAKHSKTPNFIYTSSASVYGGGNRILSEDSPLKGSTHYALSKIDGERKILESGIPFLIFRIASVYGGNAKSFLNKLIAYFKKGFVPFPEKGKHHKSFVYIEDLINAIEKSISFSKTGIYNLAHPEILSFREIVSLFEQYLPHKKKIRKIPLPVWLWKIESSVLQLLDKSSILKPLFEESQINSEKFSKDFGFSFEYSLKRVLEKKSLDI